jgi:thiol-disulfide isomerase/thioredoxin
MRAYRTVPLALAALALGAPSAPGQDDAGRKLLGEVAAAYRALPAYADEGRFQPAGGAPAWPLALTHARPARLRIEAGIATLVSDGGDRLTLLRPTRTLLKDPAPGRLAVATLGDGPVGALALGGPGGRLATILLALVLDDEPALKGVIGPNDALALEPRKPEDPEGTEAIVLTSRTGGTTRLLIDATSRLLRRMELLGAGGTAILTWDSGTIRTEPPAADAFALAVPDGVKPIAPLGGKDEVAQDAADEASHPLVGKPAPEFSLQVLDGPGKTRRVTKDDLAGRVVLIDFWASWCGPCLRELPEIATLIEDYRKRDAKLTVVALNMDRDTDTRPGRAIAEGAMKEHALKLAVEPVGIVAIDPENAMAPVFEVRGLPTVVLLDAKGVVRAVHVGFRPDIRERLAKQIDALLEGKPLAEGKPAG